MGVVVERHGVWSYSLNIIGVIDIMKYYIYVI
jgi:hypothetical protein